MWAGFSLDAVRRADSGRACNPAAGCGVGVQGRYALARQPSSIRSEAHENPTEEPAQLTPWQPRPAQSLTHAPHQPTIAPVRHCKRRRTTALLRTSRALVALLVVTLLATTASAQWQQLADIPGGEGFAGMFAGRSHNVLLAAGGANFPDGRPWDGGEKIFYREVFALEKGRGWRAIGQLPEAMAYGCSFTWRDRVVCVGGTDGQTHSDAAFALTYTDGQLVRTDLPSLPTTQAYACGALVGDTVCVVGGTASSDSTRAMTRGFALDLAADEPGWRELPNLPGGGRILAVAGAHDGALYVLSGASLQPDANQRPVRTYLRDAWRLRLGESQWQRLTDLPRAAVAAPSPAPTVGSGSLLILGGDDGSQVGNDPRAHRGFARPGLRYHLLTDRWATAEAPPLSVVTAPVAPTDNGHFVIVSGELHPGVRTPAVQSFAPEPATAAFRQLDHLALWIYLCATV